MDIICMGEMLIDFTPGNEPDSYVANPGGAPANVAISLARNGLQAGFLGILGNDDFGRKLMDTLQKDGVKVLCSELTDQAVTTLAFVTLYENGERSFTFARKPGADMLLSQKDVRKEDVEACRMLHAGSVSLSDNPCREAIFYGMKTASEQGKFVSFDVNYREMIWHNREKCKNEVDKVFPFVDFLKISDEELFFVGGEESRIPDFMEKNGIAVVIETLGSQGARYFFRGQSQMVEGLKVKAVDATGAGDAFWGGFLTSILSCKIGNISELTEEMVQNAVIYGNVSGALCVQKKGGIPALPGRREIIQYLETQSAQ